VDFSQYVFGSPYFGWLCRGLLMTLIIATASALAAALIGYWVLRCRLSAQAAWRHAGVAFVAIFRNLPLVPLLLFLTFGLPGLWLELRGRPFPSGYEFHLLILGLALNTAAYFAEILYAGVMAIGPEQIDASRTLGLPAQAIRRWVIYPQAVRIVAPALALRFIHNAKNSTMALVVPLPVGLMEVVGQAGRIAGQTFSWAEPLVFAAAIHLSLGLVLGWALNGWASRECAKIGSGAR